MDFKAQPILMWQPLCEFVFCHAEVLDNLKQSKSMPANCSFKNYV